MIYDLLMDKVTTGRKPEIQSACQLMISFGMTMETFKEHYMTLLMCGEEEGFNELPSGVKSCWTKTFNKMTASSIKRVKFQKWKAPEREGGINGENFDPERQS